MLTVEVALSAAALLAGLTGTWSPCGFSMVETLGGMASRPRTTAAACATFLTGALAGGLATFVGIAYVGGFLPGAGGRSALVAAVVIAAAAAAGELRAVRIRPQVRRQVPESWRRRLPLPLAAALYGVLLGLGFTTFVLTLAFWALVGITLALGEPHLGLYVGLAFGAGRSLPVAVLAPLASREAGVRVLELMAERPVILRRFRIAAAIALGCCAFLLAGADAPAATRVATPASDPTVAGGVVAWEGAARGVVLEPAPALRSAPHHLGPLTRVLPGTDPALGGSMLAWREGRTVRVVRKLDFVPVAAVQVPAVDALAVSDRWLAYRGRSFDGGDRLAARPLAAPGKETTIAAVGPRAQIGRPALDGGNLVFDVSDRRSSRIVAVNLATGKRRVVRRSSLEQLTNPALLRGALLYVRQSSRRQLLELGRVHARADHVLYSLASPVYHDAGHEPGFSPITQTPPPGRPARQWLWTTALSAQDAYVTLLPVFRGAPPVIVRLARR